MFERIRNSTWFKRGKWILFGSILVLLLIIVFRNLEQTNVELIFTSVSMPLAGLLTITLLIGFGLGLSASTLWQFKHRRTKTKVD